MALVFALTGGAVAATSHGGGGSGAPAKATASVRPVATVAKAKSKAKSGPRGPKGAAGPTGQAGKNGANGATGPAGAPGAKGENGAAGGPGSNGTGVTSTAFSGEKGSCVEGGTELTSASGTTLVCNGESGPKGRNGSEGSPWTDGGTLPTETGEEGKPATETGSWATPDEKTIKGTEEEPGKEIMSVPIAFPIPLKAALGPNNVVRVTSARQKKEACTGLVEPELAKCEAEQKEIEEHCPGGVEEPKAAKGYLCVYQGLTKQPKESEFKMTGILHPFGYPHLGIEFEGAGTAGAVLLVQYETSEETSHPVYMWGTWAVTAE